jgi:hypothetical protein
VRVYWSIRFAAFDVVNFYSQATAALIAANGGEAFSIYTNCNNFVSLQTMLPSANLLDGSFLRECSCDPWCFVETCSARETVHAGQRARAARYWRGDPWHRSWRHGLDGGRPLQSWIDAVDRGLVQ